MLARLSQAAQQGVSCTARRVDGVLSVHGTEPSAQDPQSARLDVRLCARMLVPDHDHRPCSALAQPNVASYAASTGVEAHQTGRVIALAHFANLSYYFEG
jgi:hypothetical protein